MFSNQMPKSTLTKIFLLICGIGMFLNGCETSERVHTTEDSLSMNDSDAHVASDLLSDRPSNSADSFTSIIDMQIEIDSVVWDSPSIDPIDVTQAWRNEILEIDVIVQSADPQALSFHWQQVLGPEQTFTHEGTRFVVGPLVAPHRDPISFVLEVTDSLGQKAETTLTIEILDRLEFALEEGNSNALIDDSSGVSEQSLMEQIILEINRINSLHTEFLESIFQDDPIIYDPT